MNDRERLIELMEKAPFGGRVMNYWWYREQIAKVAEHLIANGVTVQKQGRWLLDGRCSECLANPLTTHKSFCPNCGAKMEVDNE